MREWLRLATRFVPGLVTIWRHSGPDENKDWPSLVLYDPASGKFFWGVCDGCGVSAGDLHGAYCPNEFCPFCGRLLSHCACAYEQLDFTPTELADAWEFGLSDEQERAWQDILERKGRVRFGSIIERREKIK